MRALLVALLLSSLAACAGRARVAPVDRLACPDSEVCATGGRCTWDEERQCRVCVCPEPDDAAPPRPPEPAAPGVPTGAPPPRHR